MMIATSSSFSLGYEWNELEIKRNVNKKQKNDTKK